MYHTNVRYKIQVISWNGLGSKIKIVHIEFMYDAHSHYLLHSTISQDKDKCIVNVPVDYFEAVLLTQFGVLVISVVVFFYFKRLNRTSRTFILDTKSDSHMCQMIMKCNEMQSILILISQLLQEVREKQKKNTVAWMH